MRGKYCFDVVGESPSQIKRGVELGRPYARNLYQWLACPKCGKFRWVQLRFRKPISETCPLCREYKYRPSMRGVNHFRWKGGRGLLPSGYCTVLIYPEDPYFPMAHKHTGRVLEHRLIMAKYLGRCLQSWEHVHHKNGIRTDNIIDNLELTNKNNHTGNHNALLQEVRLLRWQVKHLNQELQALKCGGITLKS